jgi:response regulator of citrate/malate metabolism
MSDFRIEKVLIIDDDIDYRNLLRTYLTKTLPLVESVEYDPIANGDPGEDFDWSQYDVLLLDYYLCIHNFTGLDLFHKYHKKPGFPATIMLTAAGSEEIAVRALKFGIHDYLNKASLPKEKLKQTILEAWEAHQNVTQKANEITQQTRAINKELFYQKLEQPRGPDEDGPERMLIVIGLDNAETVEQDIGLIGRDKLIRHIASNSFEVFKAGSCHPNITRLSDTSVALQVDYPDSIETLEFNLKGLCNHLSKRPYQHDGNKHDFTVSTGVVKLGNHDISATEFINMAVTSCEWASQTEGNSFHIWSDTNDLPEIEIIADEVDVELPAEEPGFEQSLSEDVYIETVTATETIEQLIPEDDIETDFKERVKTKARAEAEAKAEAEADNDIEPVFETGDKAETDAHVDEQLIPEDDIETDFRERVKRKASAGADVESSAEAETRARAEAEARADAEAKARAEAEARADAEAKARAEAEEKAEAEAIARAEAEEKAEAEAKAATEARIATEAKAKAAAEAEVAAAAAAKLEAEAELKVAAEATALADAEVKAAEEAKSLADAEAKAAEQARLKAEAELKAVAETKASLESEAKAIAEARAELEAEAKAIAEAKAKLETEAKIVAEAKEKLKAESRSVRTEKVNSSADTKIKVADKKGNTEDKHEAKSKLPASKSATTGPDANEEKIKKAIAEQRGVQTFQPVIATFATDQEQMKELFKVSFQIINTDGSVITMEEINEKITSTNTKKHIDQWMLRQLLGRVVDEGEDSSYMFLFPFSEAWFLDITLYNWLQKLLSEVSNLKPGNSISIEINVAILKRYEKRAVALINTLQQNHGFQIALGGITSIEDIGSLIRLTNFKHLILNHEYIKELCNTVTSEENEEGEKFTLLQSLKRRGIYIIADDIKDSTSLTDAISAGTDYAMGNFIGETQDSFAESANVESFELI